MCPIPSRHIHSRSICPASLSPNTYAFSALNTFLPFLAPMHASCKPCLDVPYRKGHAVLPLALSNFTMNILWYDASSPPSLAPVASGLPLVRYMAPMSSMLFCHNHVSWHTPETKQQYTSQTICLISISALAPSHVPLLAAPYMHERIPADLPMDA